MMTQLDSINAQQAKFENETSQGMKFIMAQLEEMWHQMKVSALTGSVPTMIGFNHSQSYFGFMDTDDDNYEVPSQAPNNYSMEEDIKQSTWCDLL